MREECHYIKQTEEGIIQQLARSNGSPDLELASCICVQSRVISFIFFDVKTLVNIIGIHLYSLP